MEHGELDWGALARVAGWVAAVIILFGAALRLPLQTSLSPWRGRARSAVIIASAGAVATFATVALTLNDVHIDLTREKIYTPAAAAMQAIDQLTSEVSVTYFYRTQDGEGRRARDLLQVMARRNPLLKVVTIDPDREPTLARQQGISLYNAAVIEADGRRLLVQSTDEAEIALGVQRVLRGRSIVACFVEGHGELPMDNFEFHTHLEGGASHSHDDASSQVIEMPGHGIGRLRRVLEAQGYEARKLLLATRSDVPPECTLLILANPRNTFLLAESLALRRYLDAGGAALLMIDLGFAVEPELGRLLGDLGLRAEQEVVVDPLSHYSTDAEMVAVTGYDPSPITRGVSLTIYPGIRPLTLVPPAAPALRVFPLLQSSRDSYTRVVRAVDAHQVADEPRDGIAASAVGVRVLGAAVEGPLLDGRPPLRAIVIGDGDFASNSFFPYMANSDLLLSAVRWLAREERSTAITSRIPVPPLIALTGRQLTTVFVITVVLMPLLVIALGSVVWWRRR